MALTKSVSKASDVMTTDPVCVTPAATIRELARVFEEHEISGAPVVDQQGKVVGIVSKSDLIRRCSEGVNDIPPAYLFEVLSEQGTDEDPEVIPEPLVCVEDFMTADPVTVSPDAPIAVIGQTMAAKRIHRVIVVDHDNFPLGIVTCLDLIEAMTR